MKSQITSNNQDRVGNGNTFIESHGFEFQKGEPLIAFLQRNHSFCGKDLGGIDDSRYFVGDR